uniref:Lipoxygenase n=1 Tax=Kalanchoe fedtschenkoi TaxID=63787 RepID=A0A7N1A9D3_KALFE
MLSTDTQSGKSVEANVKGWLPKPSEDIIEYAADFTVPNDFGKPGAVIITNHHYKEIYLVQIVLHGFFSGPIPFPANSWIHSRNDNYDSRIIFKNQAYLPSQTPAGLRDQRREDLLSIRGNGKGERKMFDRIYDYAPYNDLGDPDKDLTLARPVLGGSQQWPSPRRCRTGRPPTKSDPNSESRVEKPDSFYVPRDERLKEVNKQSTNTSSIATGRLKEVLDDLLPQITASLPSLNIAAKIAPSASEKLPKDQTPTVLQKDIFAWLHDQEFARHTVAGNNPFSIKLLKEFPIVSKLDPEVYGAPESALTKEIVEAEIKSMSVDQALAGKRLFILDHHDMLLPFIEKMNSKPGKKAYASRTIFFHTESGTLTPIAIELSLPDAEKRVFTNGHDSTSEWNWKFAKAHVCSNDAAVHQYVNHWLRTHGSVEPYIIATHRQLSSMHPIYKLLHPHMRYTLETNANTRQNLIQGGGIVEASFSTGECGMELSSAAYDTMWRFDMEALPADLLRRGMAVEDPAALCGVKLVREDYPYAADGLLVWSAIQEWVESYVNHFYTDAEEVKSDAELQAWWSEIINKGHCDKRGEAWWPDVDTNEDLSRILTTIIWVSSGHHAAVSLGQNPSAGNLPKRPTLVRKLIPRQDDPDYENFLENPHSFFLSALPPPPPATTKVNAIPGSVPDHSPDENFLGGFDPLNSYWVSDPQVMKISKRFASRMEEIKEIINARNKDPNLKNRTGAGVPPYEPLLPRLGPGAQNRGIPNSVSI